ncbi:MAG TPA: ParB N-terminal domain-containing protein [Leptolyngbyaceae cyanobacterium]
MVSKGRRTLKQAYKENPSPELESFVFGNDSDIATQVPQNHPSQSAEEATEFGAEIIVPISKIHKTFSFTPDHKPVRYYYDLDELKEWAATDLKPNGVRTALWTRPMLGKPGEYELVAGLRRLTGCELVGIKDIPIKVFDWNDDEAYAAAFDENDRRRDFSKLEELDITLNLLSKKLGLGREDVVSLLYRMDNQAKGKSTQSALGNESAAIVEEFFTARGLLTWQSFVATRLPLLKKPPEILDAIRSSRIDYTKAVEIAKLKSTEDRKALLKQAINRRLSLSEVKQQVKTLLDPGQGEVKDSSAELKLRFKSALRRMDKVKVWKDAEKASKLKLFLDQIEQLLE